MRRWEGHHGGRHRLAAGGDRRDLRPAFTCAVYILPLFVAFQAGFWAMNHGAGIGCVLVGLAAGGLTFALGQFVLGTSRSAVIRWAGILLFAVPAVIVGYSMVLQLAELVGIPAAFWRHLFALIGAIAVGCTTFTRLAVLPSSPRPSPRPPAMPPAS